MTLLPEDGQKELADLEHSGATVMLRTPAKVDLLELMSPSSVPEALAMGARQAGDDAALLSSFWN
jgi:hypothetical protein